MQHRQKIGKWNVNGKWLCIKLQGFLWWEVLRFDAITALNSFLLKFIEQIA